MKTLVYHLAAANPVRTYPPAQGAEFIRLFLNAFPEWQVNVVGLNQRVKRKEPGNTVDELSILEFSPALDGLTAPRLSYPSTSEFTDLIPIVREADLVVGPDSAVVHLASAEPWAVPTISLWGPFAPNDRVKYYRRHYPIVGDGCTQSPCRTHEFALPVKRCERGGCNPWQEKEKTLGWCGALASITPEMILEKAREITLR